MSETVERTSLDLRYQTYRLRNDTAEARLLASIAERVIVLEGRTITREELIAALRKSMRQRSIGRLPHREYVLRYLNQHPP